MPYSKPQPTANQTAARASGKRSWQRPGGPEPAHYREFLAANQAYGSPHGATEAAYNAWVGAGGPNGGGFPTTPGGGNSGGGGRYGGGGGGGGGGMTQAMLDAMVAALRAQQQGQPLNYTPLNLPAFQGQNLPAFNAAPYTQATQALGQAVAADTASVNQNAQNTTNTLNANYTNDYANAQVTPGATQAPVGVGLTGGGGAPQQAANDVNAANGDSQAAFQNLLGVLAAASNQSQQSRLGQVSMDQTSALNQIGAQNLGLGAGINMARTQANNQWSQQDAERRYQNSLMQQQWQREQAMQNNQGVNQVGQANWTQNNAQRQALLQPILDLISSGRGLNLQGLMSMINGRRAA